MRKRFSSSEEQGTSGASTGHTTRMGGEDSHVELAEFEPSSARVRELHLTERNLSPTMPTFMKRPGRYASVWTRTDRIRPDLHDDIEIGIRRELVEFETTILQDDSVIPVIDLFAGPGGLGEGFAALGRKAGKSEGSVGPVFSLRLSIETHPVAHQTLTLRSFFRQFPEGKAPEAYYDFLRDSVTPLKDRFARLFSQYPVEASRAQSEALQAELGKPEDAFIIRERIASTLAKSDN